MLDLDLALQSARHILALRKLGITVRKTIDVFSQQSGVGA